MNLNPGRNQVQSKRSSMRLVKNLLGLLGIDAVFKSFVYANGILHQSPVHSFEAITEIAK